MEKIIPQDIIDFCIIMNLPVPKKWPIRSTPPCSCMLDNITLCCLLWYASAMVMGKDNINYIKYKEIDRAFDVYLSIINKKRHS